MEEFKTRHVNGRPYHPQSQGRVERFNRTVVAHLRTQFVDTRDWPASLPEFYFKYNNRVHRFTKPMTPHQKFLSDPTFPFSLKNRTLIIGTMITTPWNCFPRNRLR
uniref:Integrase catalytic domain-containing protein n=1 Tax=Magallana gigas TaxID=29159 RepID=A0A8W8HXA0_MAGGI